MTIESNDPVLGIGIVAKKLGISTELLRLYEREGLVVPHREKSGHRLYSEIDFNWIRCFREQIIKNKMNIAGIKILFHLAHCCDIKNDCSKSSCKNCYVYREFLISAQKYAEQIQVKKILSA